MVNNKERGSANLLSGLLKKGATATADDVKAALELPQNLNFALQRWQTRGTPAWFELKAVGVVQAAELANAVQQLSQVPHLQNINILINGLPAFETAEVAATFAVNSGGA